MVEFELPDVGEGVAEGELLAWHVAVGDEIAEDEILAEVETDKAVVDLPSPYAGTVVELHAEEGDLVPVGDVLVTIETDDGAGDSGAADAGTTAEGATAADDGAASNGQSEPEPAIVDRSGDVGTSSDAETSSDSETSGGSRVFAPPHTRRLARELDVDPRAISGSGPGGRVTDADVRDAAGASGADDAAVADAITDVAPESDVGLDETTTEPEGGETLPGPGAGAADRERTLATPATRGVAEELGVDIDAVPTDETRDGQPYVDSAAVEGYAAAQEEAQAADAAALAESEPARETAGDFDVGERGEMSREPRGRPEEDLDLGERGGTTREPYRGVRRTTGRQMEQSAFTAPHVTHHDSADVSALVEAREAMRPRAAERGIDLTYLPFVLKAVVAGLQKHPVVNTSLDEDAEEVVYKHYYDVGVATATEAGLLVPVVRSADEKCLLELASAVEELTTRARERSISREEMQGGTFTVTNFGAVGGEYATPIINYPETAILGLGSIEQRPVVVDGAVEARYTLPLSLSIDHRVIDGAEAAAFVNTVIDYLETPSLLLLE